MLGIEMEFSDSCLFPRIAFDVMLRPKEGRKEGRFIAREGIKRS